MVQCTTTRIDVDTIEYIWIIDDFPLLRNLSSKRALPDRDRIFSPSFGNEKAGTWFIALFPSGVNCDGNFISIYLFTLSENDKAASFEVSVLDKSFCNIEGSMISTSQPRIFNIDNPSWGWEDYMKTTYIQNSESIFTEERNTCESGTNLIPSPFDTNSNIAFSHIQESGINPSNIGGSQMLFDSASNYDCSSWERTILKYLVFDGKIRFKVIIKSFHKLNHIEDFVEIQNLEKRKISQKLQLARDLSSFSASCSESSIEIISIICNGECFRIPKFTLAARSEYFRKIFDSNFLDSKNSEFTIPSCYATPYILKNALDFISSADCELLTAEFSKNKNELIRLFEFSDKYGVTSLYEACVSVIIDNMNSESIWDIIISAKKCNSNAILKAAEDFLKSEMDIYTLASSLLNCLTKKI